MVTRVSNISALRDDKLVTPFSELAAKPQVRSEILIRLATLLQTSLDYKKLLSIFKKEIAPVVKVDGITFINKNHQICFTAGKQQIHSCTYKLSSSRQVTGEISFYRATRFREHELANIEALMSSLVYPLRNAMRYTAAIEQAYKDPLTGAGNRIALDDALPREVELARRLKYGLGVVMLDLDHFKHINDEFGHPMGDQVLKLAAERMRESIRQSDMLLRYGGEEFCVLINNADIGSARLVAERIRMGIERLCIESDQGIIRPTVSCGLALLEGGDSGESLLARADRALYQAKQSGRNKVCLIEDHKEIAPAV
ncbi:MAG: GGDEF domain-containing protein [Oceanospirillaceae bacterium]|nr:GGDEF domain-containing protein [Oceanospirillaceae bacterium]MCP5351208.1 GGDEF domain-containing protein [Oceanospirillaceae bacterium]